ncbi:sugar phosphate isomerase/epimerase family protein [Siminovitchia fortis]|uniref:Sugar phosphate isomerase/epimerase n=1 Tax=Siminovitchia fortis TaxID=254758 RepID=A0A443IUZ1_9BACI|nr:sugar phosphate isomerase/epimerase family protein [Siminovitchia fortis]RWR11882.1 sugar phosphate isomerase/epimerase [Siminovitchia fortis]WHY81837.1 sugar phosphate isomerase/epimerase family protein [Siminovitchia fortis]
MGYSISTYTLFALPIEPAVEALMLKGGWKSIEIMGEGKYHGRLLLYMERSEIGNLARLAKENDVSFGFHLPIEGFNPASPDEETEQIWKKCLSIAKILEVEYVLFHLGSNPSIDGGLKSAADFSNKMLQELPEKTRLLIENVPDAENAIGTSIDELVSVIQMIDDPRAGIMLDTGHCYINGQAGFLDECRKAYPYLYGLHINDNHGSSDEHLQIGEGTIPFQPLLQELKGRPIKYVFETNTVDRAEHSMNLVKINSWGMQDVKHSIT